MALALRSVCPPIIAHGLLGNLGARRKIRGDISIRAGKAWLAHVAAAS